MNPRLFHIALIGALTLPGLTQNAFAQPNQKLLIEPKDLIMGGPALNPTFRSPRLRLDKISPLPQIPSLPPRMPYAKLLELNGKQIEKGISNLGKSLAELVTLGEAGRQRDRDRAAQQKALAQLEHQHMILAKQQAVRNQEVQIVFQKHILLITERSNLILGNLQTTLKSNLETMRLLSQNVENKSLEFNAYKNIVSDQLNDLSAWLGHMGELVKATDNPNISKAPGFLQEIHQKLTEKIGAYILQLENIPQSPSEQINNETIEQGLRLGYEALDLIDTEIRSSMDSLDHEKVVLADLEGALAALNK